MRQCAAYAHQQSSGVACLATSEYSSAGKACITARPALYCILTRSLSVSNLRTSQDQTPSRRLADAVQSTATVHCVAGRPALCVVGTGSSYWYLKQ
jgi:hypothetical protein